LGNAVVTLDELAEKMRRPGRETKAIEIRYQHLAAVATEEKKEKNREFLVVGWDPSAALLTRVGRNVSSDDRAGEPQTLELARQMQPDRLRAELPSATDLIGDPEEQIAGRVASDPFDVRGLDSRSEDQFDTDVPNESVVESPLDNCRE